MASVFTQILRGELPGRFVWKDEQCFCLLTNRPIRPGHVLVVPRQEVDHRIDLEPALASHLFEVARSIGRGIQHAFSPVKVGLVIAGFEVRHVHLHVIPAESLTDLDFRLQDPNVPPDTLDKAAQDLRSSLRSLGYGAHVSN
jgi:diadenosine tetraphosphate (Ap4A) HIT family hydrolase